MLTDKNDETLLRKAVAFNNFPLAKLLVELGADVNKLYRSNTPIHLAIHKGNDSDPKLLRLLIEAGANVNVMDRDQFTPLKLAVTLQKPESFKALLSTLYIIDNEEEGKELLSYIKERHGYTTKEEIAKFYKEAARALLNYLALYTKHGEIAKEGFLSKMPLEIALRIAAFRNA